MGELCVCGGRGGVLPVVEAELGDTWVNCTSHNRCVGGREVLGAGGKGQGVGRQGSVLLCCLWSVWRGILEKKGAGGESGMLPVSAQGSCQCQHKAASRL